MTKGILKFCGRIAAWSSAGRESGASSTRARCCWMPPRRCSPKRVSWRHSRRHRPGGRLYQRRDLQALRHQGRSLPGRQRSVLASYFDNFAEVMSSSDHRSGRTRARRDRRALAAAERWTAAPSMPHWDSSSPSTFFATRKRENALPPSDQKSSRHWPNSSAGIERLGGTLIDPAARRSPTSSIATVLTAVELGSHLDDVDLYRPWSRCTCRPSKCPDPLTKSDLPLAF